MSRPNPPLRPALLQAALLFVDDVTFLSGLAFLEYPEAGERARALAKTVAVSDEDQRRLVGLVVSALVSMTDPDDESVCAHAADFILLLAADALAELAARNELVAGFGISEHPEIRQGAPPLIGRLVKMIGPLVKNNAELDRELVERWYPLVLREEEYEGLHQELYELLTGPLFEHLDAIPPGSFRRMLTLKYGHAQLLGFELLGREIDAEEDRDVLRARRGQVANLVSRDGASRIALPGGDLGAARGRRLRPEVQTQRPRSR